MIFPDALKLSFGGQSQHTRHWSHRRGQAGAQDLFATTPERAQSVLDPGKPIVPITSCKGHWVCKKLNINITEEWMTEGNHKVPILLKYVETYLRQNTPGQEEQLLQVCVAGEAEPNHSSLRKALWRSCPKVKLSSQCLMETSRTQDLSKSQGEMILLCSITVKQSGHDGLW